MWHLTCVKPAEETPGCGVHGACSCQACLHPLHLFPAGLREPSWLYHITAMDNHTHRAGDEKSARCTSRTSSWETQHVSNFYCQLLLLLQLLMLLPLCASAVVCAYAAAAAFAAGG